MGAGGKARFVAFSPESWLSVLKPDQVDGAWARVPLGYLRGYIGRWPTGRAAPLLPVPDRHRARAAQVQQTNIVFPSVPPGVYRWQRLAAIIRGQAVVL